MSMRPMIIVGCGGSGGKVVQLLRRELEIRLRRAGWNDGIPKAWQLVYLDTPATQETTIDGVGALPASDYISVAGGFNIYDQVADTLLTKARGLEDRLLGWLPPRTVAIPLLDGAGQMRAVGRAVAFSSFDQVAGRLESAYEAASSGAAELAQLYSRVYPTQVASNGSSMVASDQLPYVFVVSSLAGGTGAGIFVDVCDVFRAVNPELANRIVSVLFTAEVFQNLTQEPGLQPNSLAALSEVMAGYFDQQRMPEPLYKRFLGAPAARASSSGPSYPFVVGTSTLAGTKLDSILDCYRATTETLAAVLMDPDGVGHKLTSYQQVNWETKQLQNDPAWAFGSVTKQNPLKGVVSSFGSARLSVGTSRFEEYATARIARSVVDFQTEDFESFGKAVLNDEYASRAEIVDYFSKQYGDAFVSTCQLSEVNIEGEADTDQILDQVLDGPNLNRTWLEWQGEVLSELQPLGTQVSAVWQQQIRATVHARQSQFDGTINELIAVGSERFVREAPDRLVRATAEYTATYGLPVARGLLQFTRNDLDIAVSQLKNEADTQRQHGQKWETRLIHQFADVKERDRLSPDHDVVKKGVKAAASRGFLNAEASIRDRAVELIEELITQVIDPLGRLLEQIEAGLGSKSAEVRKWPSALGIPSQYKPPPLEFCLIPSGEWGTVFDHLISRTAEHDAGHEDPITKVRRMVGAGGFLYNSDGRDLLAPEALHLTAGQVWRPRAVGGQGMPLVYSHAYGIDDVVERSRLWATRKGTALGDFLQQGLSSYLSAHQDGTAVVDHVHRIERFEQCLDKVLQAATPMIEMVRSVVVKVHPRAGMDVTRTEPAFELLPLPPGHPAHDSARRIVERNLGPGAQEWVVDEYFASGDQDRESVTYVSMLAGAVHPSAVSSLVTPIAEAWNTSGREGTSFWGRRRARRLEEFVPVHPVVLSSMIRGWITGRMLGLIPDPDETEGFVVRRAGRDDAVFPWPPLHGPIDTSTHDRMTSWLPWLLESLPLGFALVPNQPNILEGYDELYLLGQRSRLDAQNGNPQEQYDPSVEVVDFIDNDTTAGGEAQSIVQGDDPQSRQTNVIDYLERFRGTLQKRIDERGRPTAETLWTYPDGFDLFPKIVAQCTEMIDAIKAFDPGQKGDVG
jgi:hypothetical protein